MRIEYTSGNYFFSAISQGDVFMYENAPYMRIEPIRVSDTECYNAINLATGEKASFNLCSVVVQTASHLQVAEIKPRI